MGLPEVYPQEPLCREDEEIENDTTEAPASGSGRVHPLMIQSLKIISRRGVSSQLDASCSETDSETSKESEHTGRGQNRGDIVKAPTAPGLYDTELPGAAFQTDLTEALRVPLESFFHERPGLREYGELRDSDMPELNASDLSNALHNLVPADYRCKLCRTIGFDLNLRNNKDHKGESVHVLRIPTLTLDGSDNEVASFLPSFNRMLLNCMDGSCSQCLLITTVLTALLGADILRDDTPLDRESLVMCLVEPAVGNWRQFTELLLDELENDVPHVIPAPTLIARPRWKSSWCLDPPMEDISLLIEESALPLPGMQRGGRFLKRDGVDLVMAKQWYDTCQSMHGSACHVHTKHQYPGKEQAGYMLRLLDVEENKVIVAPPRVRYVALSYVWPRDPNPFKAQGCLFHRKGPETHTRPLQDDVTAWLKVPVERLSKPVRDAIDIMRSIWQRYIWIDALCIIQDNVIDVKRTVYRMDEIYKAAAMTIIMADQDGTILKGDRSNLQP